MRERLLLCMAALVLASCGGMNEASNAPTNKASETTAKPTTTKAPKRPRLEPRPRDPQRLTGDVA